MKNRNLLHFKVKQQKLKEKYPKYFPFQTKHHCIIKVYGVRSSPVAHLKYNAYS